MTEDLGVETSIMNIAVSEKKIRIILDQLFKVLKILHSCYKKSLELIASLATEYKFNPEILTKGAAYWVALTENYLKA